MFTNITTSHPLLRQTQGFLQINVPLSKRPLRTARFINTHKTGTHSWEKARGTTRGTGAGVSLHYEREIERERGKEREGEGARVGEGEREREREKGRLIDRKKEMVRCQERKVVKDGCTETKMIE